MGLFSSKIKITVATTVSRVIEDKMLPDSVKSGLIKGLLRDNEQIVENILEDMSSNIAIKAERMYRYGQNKYIYGLPKSDILQNTTAIPTLETVIGALEGQDTSMIYTYYAPFNSLHFGWKQLVELHGYDPISNEIKGLSAIKGFPVYLDDMYVVIPTSLMASLNATSLVQWGTSAKAGYTPLRPVQDTVGNIAAPSPVQVNALATVESVVVKYMWQASNGSIQTGAMEFLIPDTGDHAVFFQAKYTVTLPNGTVVNPDTGQPVPVYKTVTKYFTYEQGAGTYPELDSLFSTTASAVGSFFPFAYFRLNKTSQTEDLTSPAYKSTKKLLKYLNMDYNAVGDGINGNPDIDDVEQAMMIMAVPKYATKPIELRYLFDFFYRVALGYAGSTSLTAPLPSTIAYVGAVAPDAISIVIQDTKFKMKLTMTQITKRLKAGVIGNVGAYAMGVGTQDVSFTTDTRAADGSGGDVTVVKQEDVVYYRKQISQHMYQEVRITGLQMSYVIREGYMATADIVLIPLDYEITQHYSNPDRELLYASSLHYVFNSLFETKIAWYAQSWFKGLMIVVALVIMVVTWGGSTGISASLLALAEMTFAQLIMTLIINLAIMVAVNLAMKLFVKMLGPEAALILALVLAVAGVVDIANSGSLAGAPFAQDLLQLSTGLIKSAGDFYTEQLMGIKSEYEALGMDIKEKTELLESANKLLQNDNMLNPFVIFGESPSDYYNRTIHSGNIGTRSIDAISSYVDNALTLPELAQTLEEF